MNTWTALVALMLSAVAGVIAERFLDISGRLLQPLWYWTFGWVYRWNRRRSESRFAASSETFAVGAAQHDIYVRQFALDGFLEENVVATLEPSESVGALVANLPSDLHFDRDGDVEGRIERKREHLTNSPDSWNAEKFGLARVTVSREGTKERPVLRLGFIERDYAAFQVVASEWEERRLRGGRQLTSEELLDILPGLSNSFGVNLTVETADDHLLLTR